MFRSKDHPQGATVSLLKSLLKTSYWLLKSDFSKESVVTWGWSLDRNMSEQFLCFNVKKVYVCASVGILLNNSTICTVQQQEFFMVLLCGCETCRSNWERCVDWGCMRTECWGAYLSLRGTREQGNGENYRTKSLIICTSNPLFFGWSKRYEWGGRDM